MLNATLTTALLRASAALRATNKPANASLAAELDAALLTDATQRASVSAKAAQRAIGTSGRAPSRAYVIEQQPGPIACVMGAKAAHAELERVLTGHGSRACPKVGSLGAMLSQRGNWFTLLETDNGTVAVNVRPATKKELARLMQ